MGIMTELFAVERGSGTPLVVLHGVTIDHQMMLPLDPVIAAAGEWRRYYLDLPGHGRSAAIEPMTTDAVVAAVAGYIERVIGDRPFALIGASFGGEVAIALTDLFGDQVLGSALLAPAVLPRSARTLPANTVSVADENVLATLTADDRAAFTYVTAQQDRVRWELFAAQIRPGLRAYDRDAVAALLAAPHAGIRQPRPHHGEHLIVTGRQDAVVGWRDQQRLLQYYPHTTYAALDRCGHNVYLEQPHVVGALLTDWLHALRPAR